MSYRSFSTFTFVLFHRWPLFLLTALFSISLSITASAADRSIALVGGMLLDGYEALAIHNAVIVIEGNIITAEGYPRTGQDTSGRTVMSGLIDTHVHTELIGHGNYLQFFDYIDKQGIDWSEN